MLSASRQADAIERKSPNRRQTHAAGWTEDRLDWLKELWTEGKSCAEIARLMGGGLTRNGVIGKVHRLQLKKRGRPEPRRVPRPIREPRRAQAWPPLGPVEPFYEEPEQGVDVTRLLGLLQLNEHTCKWPIGDPLLPGFGFCGAHTEAGSPYCAAHRKRAWVQR